MAKKINRLFLLIVLVGCVLAPVSRSDNIAATEEQPNRDFCRKCHIKETEAVESRGLSHKTEVSCNDCHQGHKPKSQENIPRCSQCHTGTAHYDQLQCLNCHRDPHQPMRIKLPPKAYAECLTCHVNQGKELKSFPSYHSTLVCTDCHYEHRFLPQCTSCHRSHGPAMAETDCQGCHAPHKPLELAFSRTDIPTAFCSPCHAEASLALESSRKKHRDLSCVKCHAEQHGMVPACQDCHGKPHAAALHSKFPNCADCHETAHDLE